MPFALALTATTTESAPDYGNIVALVSGLTALLSIAITSLRKRKDVSVEEMQQRIRDLEASNDEKDQDVQLAQKAALDATRRLFVVRQVLAARGIPDPTEHEDPR